LSYLSILGRPGVLPVVLAMMVSRLNIGINGLAVLLYVGDQTGSFATAGLASGAIALGMAAGGPLQSRFVADSGIRVLNLAACAYVAGMLGVWLLGDQDGLLLPLLLAALVAGASVPSTSAVLRSRWPDLLSERPDATKAAYALDSVLIQILVVIGPLVTAAAVAWTGIEGALAFSMGSALVGTLVFTALLRADVGRGGGRPTSILHLGALASPGLRTLINASVPLGFFIGAVEVALPAYAEEIGDPELAGVLLAVFAGASIVAGLLYGARSTRASLGSIHRALSALLPIICLPLVFAESEAAVIVLAAIGGLPVSPLIASRNELVNVVSVPGRAAESFSWPLTAMIVGISLGAAAGGALADAHGWSAAVLAAVGAAAAGAGLLLLQSRRLDAPDPEAVAAEGRS
jgi:predicted MFS family arabinose efflux permease